MQRIHKTLIVLSFGIACTLPALSAWAQVGDPPTFTVRTEAFTYRLDRDAGQDERDLVVRVSPDGNEEIVYAATRIESFVSSPDEQRLAVIQGSESIMAENAFGSLDAIPTDLILVVLDTGETEQVNARDFDVEFWANRAVSSAAWSPESNQLVYDWRVFSPYTQGVEPSDHEVYLYTLADAETMLLANLGTETTWIRLAWFTDDILVQESLRSFTWFTPQGEQVQQDFRDGEGMEECGGLPTRLADTTYVTVLPGEPNNLREYPYLDAPVLGQISAGQTRRLSYSHTSICVDGIRFWEVLTEDQQQSGWTAESADGEYFLAPADEQ